MKTGAYYGIDFGTTNTSVYLYQYEEGRGAIGAGYGTDAKSEMPFSSCIAIPEDGSEKMKYGREVKENFHQYTEQYRIITSFKSLLGTDQEVVVHGKRYNGKELVTLFLHYVKETVRRERPDFQEAIFSIPVDFSAKARTDLLEAAEGAGIHVKGFISESSAAYVSAVAVEKAIRNASSGIKITAYSRVLVIDFGGGTLDLSILELKGKQIREEAVYGISFGGDDIDRELALRVLPKIFQGTPYEGYSYEKLKEREPKRVDWLMNQVERMKINFSEEEDYTMTLGSGFKPFHMDYETFSDIIKPLIIKNVFGQAIPMVLKKAAIGIENVDQIILTGGSSGLRPFVEEILDWVGGEKVLEDEDYQWMVAKGAAVTAAMNCAFRLSEDICVLLSDGTTYPILEKGSEVGTQSEPISFSLTEDAQDAHFIFTDSTGKNRYAMISVQAKGYLDETFDLRVTIGTDQIARVTIQNETIKTGYQVEKEIHQLCFYYDLVDIEG